MQPELYAWHLPPRQLRRRIVLLAMVTCIAALCTIGTIAMWCSGDPMARTLSKYLAAFGASWFILLALAITPHLSSINRRPVRTGQIDGQDSTIVAGSRTYFWLTQALFACYAVMLLVAAVEIVAASAWNAYWHFILFCIGTGLVLAVLPILALFNRVRPSKLVLTPEIIAHCDWTSATELHWDDLDRVITSTVQLPMDRRPLINIVGLSGARWSHRYYMPYSIVRGKPNPLWTMDSPPHTGWITLECARFAVDRTALYRYLAFYAENPASRKELGTQSGLDRWHATEGTTR
ncbi:hypothetical protein [Nocardia sp. NPDC058666]|uniref:hypothetical protein n=1 Tax=Nocardia sp. NPDC058666 TaxID=3346587 RepID=UPI003668253A